jgi:hypothetical protein
MTNLRSYLFEFIFFLLLFFSIVNLSIIHSEYYSDLHHWSFIAQNSLDYINGRLLFKEVFVHYGVGQLIFLDLINNLYKITFTSIGVVTSVVYFLNLLILYLIIKRILNSYFGFFTIITIFFANPIILYPWPDYIAGLCLLLFFYFTLLNRNLYFLPGFFLFLAIIFRSTYIFNIFISILVYFFIINFNKKFYNTHLVRIFLIFLFLFIFYLCFLFFNNDLSNWFLQSIAPIQNYYELSQDAAFRPESFSDKIGLYIYNTFGNSLFSFFKLFKLIIKFVINLLFPRTIENLVFFIFYITNILFIFFFLIKSKLKSPMLSKVSTDCIFLFFSLLGFFGVIQSLYAFNFFRNFNASSSVFFISAIFLKNYVKIKFNNIKIYKFIIVILLSLSFLKFFSLSKSIFIINKNLFKSTYIKYFDKRKFNNEDFEYYSLLNSILCSSNKKIYNFTLDHNLTYLCSNKKFFHYILTGVLIEKDFLLMKDFLEGNFEDKTIYITTIGPNVKGIFPTNIINPPESITYHVRRSYTLNMYRSSKIYIYQK